MGQKLEEKEKHSFRPVISKKSKKLANTARSREKVSYDFGTISTYN